MLEDSFESALEKTDEQIKVAKNWAIENSGLSKHQAKFFAMMELNLVMMEQLRTFAEKINKNGKFCQRTRC